MDLIDSIRFRHLKEVAMLKGFPGTADMPVVSDDWHKLQTLTQYKLAHLHTTEGKCMKNRFGYFC